MKNSIKISLILFSAFFLANEKKASAQKDSIYGYTGAMQTWTVPSCVDSVTIDCYGAQGIGVANEYYPGYGGEARGVLAVTPGEVLYIYVGGQAGWNGGGLGQNGANGGDASDVRVGGTALANRVIVAGGGGGSGGDNWYCVSGVYGNGGGGVAVGSNFVGGGGGEGYTSVTGCGANGATNGGAGGGGGCHGGGGGGGGLTSGGAGATATCGPYTADSGALGQGGAAYAASGCASEGAGGGGGGYYGGGGSVGYNCGAGQGGGGSSWTGTLSQPFFSTGTWTGVGQITLTWTPGSDSLRADTAKVISNVNCHGGNDGSAYASLTGGMAPFSYSWAPSGGTMDTATGLTAGTYTVTANSACGSAKSSIVTITEPTTLGMVSSSTSDTGNCNGTAMVTVSGGTAPYNYSWTGGGTKDTIAGKCAGTYCCTVTDSHGCTDSMCVVITSTAGIQNISNASSIRIYPDPNTGLFNVSGVKHGQVVEVYNSMGQMLMSTVAGDNKTMNFNISDMASGIYLVKIKNSDGTIVAQKKIMKTE